MMRTILITGSNRGIGLEFAKQYLQHGDKVIATCRRPAEATALQELRQQYPTALTIHALDVSNPESIEQCVQAVHAEITTLDVLINNAGIPYAPTWEMSENLATLQFENVLDMFRVHTVGPLILTQQLLDLLRASGQGRIVNLSSWLASIAEKNIKFATCYGYSGSKVALNMYTRIMAQELAPDNILTVTFNPGWVRTDMGGPNAFQSVEESVGGMIAVIDGLTPERSGQFLVYNGNQTAW
jgi:NAD(P)-dependent dehydrogenase (short-subunit alcohol dehydrogenase family)